VGKIPVFRTVGRAYGFAIGRYLTVLGIIWLPLALLTVISHFLIQPYYLEFAAHGGQQMPLGVDPRFERANLLMQLVVLVVSTMVSVGIAREILGLRTGPRFVYFRFGGAEFRALVGSFALILLLIVIVVGMIIGASIAGIALAAVTAGLEPRAAALAKALIAFGLIVFVMLALVFIMARLSFLFLPATVAEGKIGIARSWELTRGNFWRIFWIGFLIFVPLVIAFFCFVIAILGPGYFEFALQHAKDPQAIQAYVMQRVQPIVTNPLAIAGSFLLYPIIYGLAFSPPAFAYRALVPGPVGSEPVEAKEPVKKEDDGLPPVLEEILDKPSDHGEDEKH
jgi:hypothetical protein